MFTIDEMLSEQNQKEAMDHFKTKREQYGKENDIVSDLEADWMLNRDRIADEIRNGLYKSGVIKIVEIMSKTGKKRKISILNTMDRYIARMLAQKLKQYICPEFCQNSYAYQEGKSILDAVNMAKEYIDSGGCWMVEIDLKDYFDTIPLELMMDQITKRINDSSVCALIRSFLYCKVLEDGNIQERRRGIITGNPISPILSNLYLHEVDLYLQKKGYQWIRFADNINIYTRSIQEAQRIFDEVMLLLDQKGLEINIIKSGVYSPFERRLLGYDFIKRKKHTEVRRHIYQPIRTYYNWHPSALTQINKEYHILQEGILNKKDYSILFENQEHKYYIPVEVTEQLNLYSDITISASARKLLSQKGIRLAFMDSFGEIVGYYMPQKNSGTAKILLKQCSFYEDEKKHLEMARKLEISGLHNMRANFRYYKKKGKDFDLEINILTSCIAEMTKAASIQELMLIEARARQMYYAGFNKIIENKDFFFEKRSRRPPLDAINAMISFGNALLYNFFIQSISRTSLDLRIGVVHAANRRVHSLNLDFADLFKPVISDRVIFSIINRKQLCLEDHFERTKSGGIYLNNVGKEIFLDVYEKKLQERVVVGGKSYTYRQQMDYEVRKFFRYIVYDEAYKPYKYY